MGCLLTTMRKRPAEAVRMAASETRGMVIVGRAALIYDPADPTAAAPDDDGAELRFGPLVFEDAIRRGGNVICCREHEPERLIATTGDGNLKLRRDGRGLLWEVANPDPEFATPALYEDIACGLVGSSYHVVFDSERTYEFSEGGKRVREVCAVRRIRDVAIVRNPRFAGGVTWLRPADLTGQAAADFDRIAEFSAVAAVVELNDE